jgi:hypothetical protein
MNERHSTVWEVLFQRALGLIDSVSSAGTQLQDWSFGGGTVLMRKASPSNQQGYRHFLSRSAISQLSDAAPER